MKSPCRSPRPASGYTLVEVLVAMSILALVVGAASRLSLSQSQSEELIGRESHAVNFAENIARLWQLGVDNPSSILLDSPNKDGSLMSTNFPFSPTDVNGDTTDGEHPIHVHRTWVTVVWQPIVWPPETDSDTKNASKQSIEFSIVRPKPPEPNDPNPSFP